MLVLAIINRIMLGSTMIRYCQTPNIFFKKKQKYKHVEQRDQNMNEHHKWFWWIWRIFGRKYYNVLNYYTESSPCANFVIKAVCVLMNIMYIKYCFGGIQRFIKIQLLWQTSPNNKFGEIKKILALFCWTHFFFQLSPSIRTLR